MPGLVECSIMTAGARKPSSRQALGRLGEAIAVQALGARGYEVITRNWRCRAGEIDIIARFQGVWVFAEVRTRRSEIFGTPEESITPKKQAKLIEVAMTYLSERGLNDVQWRIDVVAVEIGRDGNATRVAVIPNAVESQ